jgi:hypothetical protein
LYSKDVASEEKITPLLLTNYLANCSIADSGCLIPDLDPNILFIMDPDPT